ncbi:peptide ABC transporter substrate-binding protein [Candidatus Poribacteria bacterium]|nr:peptide ABC transporter substrate-binding protein [Candidatus Poribacteria bacterium]
MGEPVKFQAWGAFLLAVALAGCDPSNPNNPYRAEDAESKVYYSTFEEPPKHLDPARSYSANEYAFIAQIYEPPFQYHYLKRPYELIPLTAESVPEPQYYDAQGTLLEGDPPAEKVARAVYEIRIQPGILYQPHPCFAKRPDGSPANANLTDADVESIDDIGGFAETGTRELAAKDYVYQIQRLADPRLSCPILSTIGGYIEGMEEYAAALEEALSAARAERQARGGIAYNADRDERYDPISLDYGAFPLPGAEVVDDHTYRIVLTRKYPQILYWLAMPFFSPMPPEAIAFYDQGALIRKNMTIDQYPVGTGAYRFATYNPNLEIVLTRNENYRTTETYPSEGEPNDDADGFLASAGQSLPFIDRFVYKLEKEDVPRWSKFLQGYYDASGISSDNFDRAIVMNAETGATLSPWMQERGVQLTTAVNTATYYLAFNMLDPVVGGYEPEKRKLRQAISIAIDTEEYVEIFANGRALAAHGPIPPGIFGRVEGRAGMNPFVYDWNDRAGAPVRKSLDEAKRLLAEAGYPNGRGKDGKPLRVSFDNVLTGAGDQATIRWYSKKLEALGATLVSNATDYSRFQDKVHNANFQIISWGWLADYPDPENFLFLLYGPNGKKEHDGENAANYDNPDYNRLFAQMENMTNTPERQALIDRMLAVAQEDAPWIWGFHPVSFGLRHAWIRNAKPNQMANGTLKYLDLDPAQRKTMRARWNKPNYTPLLAVAGLLVLGSIPAVVTVRRREHGR